MVMLKSDEQAIERMIHEGAREFADSNGAELIRKDRNSALIATGAASLVGLVCHLLGNSAEESAVSGMLHASAAASYILGAVFGILGYIRQQELKNPYKTALEYLKANTIDKPYSKSK